MATDEVVVGIVGKPFGVRGDVYVRPDPDLDHEFPAGTTYRVAGGGTLTVAATWLHGNRRIVRFDEAADRDAAERLRGATLCLSRDALELADDALWVDDLVGAEVRDGAGALVGVIESVRDGHAHDYLVVARTDGGEVLVPLVADLIEVGEGAVVVRAIPGLLDDDADTV